MILKIALDFIHDGLLGKSADKRCKFSFVFVLNFYLDICASVTRCVHEE
jgi:hypothetical protein